MLSELPGYLKGVRENYQRRQETFSSKVWIKPEKRAELDVIDLQVRMTKASKKINEKEISKIYFTPNMVGEMEARIKKETEETNRFWDKKGICIAPEALRHATSTIITIVEKTLKTKEDIALLTYPEMFEYLASLVYDNSARVKGEDKTTYHSLSEIHKNKCRNLIVHALEVYANPAPPLLHR